MTHKGIIPQIGQCDFSAQVSGSVGRGEKLFIEYLLLQEVSQLSSVLPYEFFLNVPQARAGYS
jgi:hypothetical protein